MAIALARLSLSVFVIVKVVSMNTVLWVRTAVRGYLLGHRVAAGSPTGPWHRNI